MDMNTVIMLRRNRNPGDAEREQNRAQDQIPGERRGFGKRKRRHLVDLLSGEHDRADDRDQDQHAGDFKRQQVVGEKLLADLLRVAVRERAELARLRWREARAA